MVESDVLDMAVGFSEVVRLGVQVKVGDPLLRIHASREDKADAAAAAVFEAMDIGDQIPDMPPLIHERSR
jgi:thymidine phosphorylase